MPTPRPGSVRGLLLLCLLALVGAGGGGAYYWQQHHAAPAHAAPTDDDPDDEADHAPQEPRVEVVRPSIGEMDRVTVQIGTVQSFEAVNLYSRVAGFLKAQAVDIGDHVKKGDVLAVIDVPELQAELRRRAAAVEQAEAKITQTEARVRSAKADQKAVEAAQVQADAAARSAAATLRFREKQYQRMKDLYASQSIDERLVDEKHEQRDAAAETERAAKAAIETSKAQATAAEAKVHQVEADVVEAKAEVRVAKAELARAQAMVDFATLHAPFDGVVTQRNLVVSDFVRAADGNASGSLLRVERVDKVRVVVHVPDRDAPYANVGDPATVELDALPGSRFTGRISRTAESEDPQTRMMRVEVDLPNPDGKIRQGMYGRTTLMLERVKTPSVPTSCLVGKPERGKGSVYVVREDGRAHLVPVELGQDNGVRHDVLRGLVASDRVVRRPPSTLSDGAAVVASEAAH